MKFVSGNIIVYVKTSNFFLSFYGQMSSTLTLKKPTKNSYSYYVENAIGIIIQIVDFLISFIIENTSGLALDLRKTKKSSIG